ncbi:MAG: HEAT repeat domain-containing protein [Desulfuromonadales bacterium]|nr:HEAT repeat domain-containing protein [Desulfuromonadales bacterium]
MNEVSPQILQLEAALRLLARLFKAVRYYPLRHPALTAAIEEARQGFAPLLQGGEHLIFLVRKEGFLLGELPVAPANPILGKLALHLFARRVQSLLILPDLTGRDLKAFARCLSLAPPAIQSLGGMAEVLFKAKVSTLWVNETDLSRILTRKDTLEAEKYDLPGDEDRTDDDLEQLFESGNRKQTSGGERDLEGLLNELRQEQSDQQYRLLLQEMPPLVRLALAETDRYLVLDALYFLQIDAVDQQRSVLRRALARQALEQLGSDEVLEALVDFLCTRGVTDTTRQVIARVLSLYPEKTVRRLMERLAEEKELAHRRLIIEALICHGAPAVPLLTEFLTDGRWFVVRNAVSILGEIREPSTASLLPPLLQHRDLRVARETIRALTKIGGTRAVGILLSLVEGNDQDLARQALLSLGAMKNTAAVPTLLRLIDRSDLLGKRFELKKGAIKALGEIGTTEASPTLVALLKRRPWWRTSQFDELRAAAATALGEIGEAGAIPALQGAAEDRSASVARAAAQALKQLRKAEAYGTGII